VHLSCDRGVLENPLKLTPELSLLCSCIPTHCAIQQKEELDQHGAAQEGCMLFFGETSPGYLSAELEQKDVDQCTSLRRRPGGVRFASQSLLVSFNQRRTCLLEIGKRRFESLIEVKL